MPPVASVLDSTAAEVQFGTVWQAVIWINLYHENN